MKVIHLTTGECLTKRDDALARLRMTLDEARAQWDECGCCLINGNWHDLLELEVVREMDFLLGEKTGGV